MTKLFQEQVARTEAEQLGISLVILRFFNVYGPRQSPDNPYTGLVTTFALRLSAGRPLTLYECGSPVRDFVHVDDVVSATIKALDVDVDSTQTLNIGTGRSVTLVQLAGALGRAFGREPVVELSTRFRIGDIHASIANIERARRVLGYQPSLPIGVGLRVWYLSSQRAKVRIVQRPSSANYAAEEYSVALSVNGTPGVAPGKNHSQPDCPASLAW